MAESNLSGRLVEIESMLDRSRRRFEEGTRLVEEAHHILAEIQQALIRQNYLTGEPTGEWDARTQAALIKYQGDNGWQTKVVPDSRALIKLGLGPNYSAELLNGPPKALPAATPSTTASRSIEGTAGGKQ